MNSCTFTGRLGKDPELRSVGDRSVCNFSLAVNRRKRDADALWLDVSVWGKQGETVARFLAKGSEAAVTGRIDVREYERRDGGTGFSLTLDATDVSFIGPKADAPSGGQGGGSRQAAPAASGGGYQDDDDIPF